MDLSFQHSSAFADLGSHFRGDEGSRGGHDGLPRGRDRLRRGHFVLLAFVVCAAWGGVVSGSFQYDDYANVLLDPATTNLDALLDRLFGGIRPLTRLSYATSAMVFGDWAGGWLIAQLLLHLATAITVAELARRRTGNVAIAIAAGALFAMVPTHGAVVAYVSGRSHGLSACLLLFALLMHEMTVGTDRRGSGALCATLLFLLACAARETALVFPVIVALWELTRDRTLTIREVMSRTAPYLIAALVLVLAMLLLVPRYVDLLQFSFAWRSPVNSALANVAALPATLSLWLQPWRLSVEHATQFSNADIAVGATALIALIVSAVAMRRSHPMLMLALLWPVVALLPTHSFIAKLDAVTEGPLYLAAVGPAIAAAHYGMRASFASSGHRSGRVFVLLALGAACAICAWRAQVWADPVRLWREATIEAPQSARAWNNLGIAQLSANQPLAARESLRVSLALDPANVRAFEHLEIISHLVPRTPETAAP